MTLPRLARLLITLSATAGFITALAYWWLDNKTHELIGCAALALVITHIITADDLAGISPHCLPSVNGCSF